MYRRALMFVTEDLMLEVQQLADKASRAELSGAIDHCVMVPVPLCLRHQLNHLG